MTYNNEFSISVKTAEETINGEFILNSNYSKKFVVDEIEIVKTLIMNFLLRLSLLNKMQEDKIKNIGSIQATLFFDSLDIKGYDIKKWVHSSFKNKLVKNKLMEK